MPASDAGVVHASSTSTCTDGVCAAVEGLDDCAEVWLSLSIEALHDRKAADQPGKWRGELASTITQAP